MTTAIKDYINFLEGIIAKYEIENTFHGVGSLIEDVKKGEDLRSRIVNEPLVEIDTLQRYTDTIADGMEKSNDGNWIKYDDIVDLIKLCTHNSK